MNDDLRFYENDYFDGESFTFFYCYITIDVLNEAENSPLHLTRYFYGSDRYAKE